MSSQTISFRIDSATVKVLEDRARRAGMTPSGFSREAVLARLSDEASGMEELREENRLIREDLAKLRGELAMAAKAILIVAGRKEVYPKELAEEWVNKNLGVA